MGLPSGRDANTPASGTATCRSTVDLAGDLLKRRIAWLLWCVPLALFGLGSIWSEARVWLWAPALLLAGTACLANARRCGRRHCFVTGPLYLLGAVATLLTGLHLLALRWSWIAEGLLLGTAAACALECFQGRYAAKG